MRGKTGGNNEESVGGRMSGAIREENEGRMGDGVRGIPSYINFCSSRAICV